MAYPEATWASGTTYAINALVNYQGVDYISLANSNTNNIPSATRGTSWNVYTSWLVGTTYASGNAVDYTGFGYVSLQNSNTGHIPSTNPTWWTIVMGEWGSRAGNVSQIRPFQVSGIFGRMKPARVSTITWSGPRVTSATDFSPWSKLQPASIVIVGRGPSSRLGLTGGSVRWGYSVPQIVVGPDGLIILVGAPFTAKLGIPS